MELMEHLQKRWDYLNTGNAEAIITHICKSIHRCASDDANSLQDLMMKYKKNIRNRVTRTLKECKRKKVKPVSPENHITMAVKIDCARSALNVYLYQILDVKDELMRIFNVGSACFAGWDEGSIVLYFFLPEKAVYSPRPKLKSGYATLQRLHVTTVVVFDHFSMDVCSQRITLLHKVGVACYSVMLWEVCEFAGE